MIFSYLIETLRHDTNMKVKSICKLEFLLSILAAIFSSSCSEPIKYSPPVAAIQIADSISYFNLDGSASTVSFGKPLTYQWSVSSNVIRLTYPTARNAFFRLPADSFSIETAITLEVNDGSKSSTSTTQITVPPLTQVRAYGLGKNLVAQASNNVPQEWYIDQSTTGVYNTVNCGPTAVTMAIKWFNPNFQGTPQDARNTYESSGGDWYTNDIINYLNLFNVPNSIMSISSGVDQIITAINQGQIAILCLDMNYVTLLSSATNSNYHYNKFYSTPPKAGHFIIVKGYKQVDNTTYLEVYDPNSFGIQYGDGGLKGKDRYYKKEDLDKATFNWWRYAIILSPTPINGGIYPDSIVHKSG